MENEKKSVSTDSSLLNSKTDKKQTISIKEAKADTVNKELSATKNLNSTKNPSSTKKQAKIIDKTEENKSNNKDKENKKGRDKEDKEALRTRLKSNSIDLVELEQLNEQNLKHYSARARRNRVIIIVLTLLLLIVGATIGVLLGISKLSNNSFLYVHGDGSAVYIVDGNELTRFRTPADVQGNRLLELDINLKIESSGNYNIKFTIEIYQNNEKLENTLIYEPNRTLFAYGNDGYYYSKSSISGGQTIDLCGGVMIDYAYENSLNIGNFKMEVHTYLERV